MRHALSAGGECKFCGARPKWEVPECIGTRHPELLDAPIENPDELNLAAAVMGILRESGAFMGGKEIAHILLARGVPAHRIGKDGKNVYSTLGQFSRYDKVRKLGKRYAAIVEG